MVNILKNKKTELEQQIQDESKKEKQRIKDEEYTQKEIATKRENGLRNILKSFEDTIKPFGQPDPRMLTCPSCINLDVYDSFEVSNQRFTVALGSTLFLLRPTKDKNILICPHCQREYQVF